MIPEFYRKRYRNASTPNSSFDVARTGDKIKDSRGLKLFKVF